MSFNLRIFYIVAVVFIFSCKEPNNKKFKLDGFPKQWVKLSNHNNEMLIYNSCDAGNSLISIDTNKFLLHGTQDDFEFLIIEILKTKDDTILFKVESEDKRPLMFQFYLTDKEKEIGIWKINFSNGFSNSEYYVSKEKSSFFKTINQACSECWDNCGDNSTKKEISKLEKQLIEQGLVDILQIDSSIKTDIKYSSTDNFMKIDMYKDYAKAYLQKDVAEKLSKAQKYLKEEYPNYSLLVFDATRPRSVQQMMWDSLKMPIHEKTKFVSNPKNGSLHNFGAAVDLTIIDENGNELDMATTYDFIGKLAYPRLEKSLLKENKITQEQINNRTLLRKVMKKAGFYGIQTEWWHFNSCTRKQARKKYKIVE